jgi:hypothetical protein
MPVTMTTTLQPAVRAALQLAANIDPFGSVENAQARDAAAALLAPATTEPTNFALMAWQLERTAMGDGFHGEALRAALDLPGITDDDAALLARYIAGVQAGTDHVQLQWLAMTVDGMARKQAAERKGWDVCARQQSGRLIDDLMRANREAGPLESLLLLPLLAQARQIHDQLAAIASAIDATPEN